MMACPGPDTFEALVLGTLDAESRRSVERHLETCTPCREEVSNIEENLRVADSVAEALGALEEARETTPDAGSPPERLGPFSIVNELGRGGMAVVYLAEQDRPRRKVALKVLHPGASPTLLRRFEHEANLLARLRHPGIAQVYEAGTTGGRPYLAMEPVRGEPLDAWVRRSELGARDKLTLLAQICDAVHHAHLNGVVHRDLKPSNVLVEPVSTDAASADASSRVEPPSRRGPRSGDRSAVHARHRPVHERARRSPRWQPKVLDFGVARAVDMERQTLTVQTEVGQILGTVPFMSPEQLLGDSTRIDARSDVYSLGVLGYWMLTGALPYDLAAASILEAARVIREELPAPIESPIVERRSDLETILRKALEKQPEQRYQSASELAAEIRRYLDGEPILARSPTAAQQIRRLISRHRTPFVVAAILFVVAIVYGVTMSILFDRARDARQLAHREAETAREVSIFLEALFVAPDPWVGSGGDVTALEILDRGAARVRTGFPENPELQSRLLRTLGKTYARLGRTDRGREFLEDAYRVRRDDPAGSVELLAESIRDLGTVDAMSGEYARAESLYAEAVDVLRGSGGPAPRALASSLTGLARTRMQLGRSADVETLLKEALALWERPLRSSQPLTAAETDDHTSTLLALATLRRSEGALEEAEALLKRVVEARRAAHGNEHIQVAVALNNLAGVLDEQGKREEAIPLMQDALEIARVALEPDDAERARIASNLASLLSKSGDLEAAEPLMREALEAQRRTLGDRHPDVAWRLHNLGFLLLEKGQPAEAVPLLEKAISIRQVALPPEHWATAESRGVLGACYAALGRFEEAEPLLLASYPAIRSARGEEDRLTVRAGQRLLDLYGAWGRPDRAASIPAMKTTRPQR